MNTQRTLLPWIMTIFGVLAGWASIAAAPPDLKPMLLGLSGALFIGGAIWEALIFIRFPESARILRGARAIGMTNVQPHRLRNGTSLRYHLERAKRIRIFAVSGNRTVEDFGSELQYALHENASRIQIIFSTNDDYIDSNALTPIIIGSCQGPRHR